MKRIKAPVDELKRYLRSVLRLRKRGNPQPAELAYLGMEDFLLKHGRCYTYSPLPQDVTPGAVKMCFHNAFKLAKRRKWVYVEGVATSVIPLHHAWVINPAEPDKVIDPTWDNPMVAEQLTGERAYYGVPFNLEAVAQVRKRQSSMLDDWQAGFPLFAGKIPNWAA
jgi:hypothetical protein